MNMTLCFDIYSYWHIGNGKEAGAYADAALLLDHQGLPYIPGKSIKGLLRDAFSVACSNHWFAESPESLLDVLFGNEGTEGQMQQGMLRIASATLAPAEVAFFNQTPSAKGMLRRSIHQTALDAKTGVAKNTSLRSTEVAVPMVLNAQVSVDTNHPQWQTQYQTQLPEWLSAVTPLISEFGAKRHRGLGRVEVTLCSEEPA